MEKHAISIWFFIGLTLVVYGALILGAGIYDFFFPLKHQVVMSKLHAGIWWGALLLALGSIYSFKFFPGKKQK